MEGEAGLGTLALSSSPVGSCLGCHAENFEVAPDPSKTDRESENGPGADGWHDHSTPPLASCGECHRVHDGSPKGLLRGAYPATDYAAYERGAYSGCLQSCHPPELVEAKETTTATRFRNAQDNLHYRHVVGAGKNRGRSCRLCHEPHQARNTELIRSSMPYGKERLTLDYSAGEAGGRCATSCHITTQYDREEAIPSRMRVLSGESRGEQLLERKR